MVTNVCQYWSIETQKGKGRIPRITAFMTFKIKYKIANAQTKEEDAKSTSQFWDKYVAAVEKDYPSSSSLKLGTFNCSGCDPILVQIPSRPPQNQTSTSLPENIHACPDRE